MNLEYIANVRLPTPRAHGLQIMKMCEAFTLQGAFVLLVDGTEHLFTHDSGAGYRLSISRYVRGEKKEWVPAEYGILESGRTKWDAYFQADPFILICTYGGTTKI